MRKLSVSRSLYLRLLTIKRISGRVTDQPQIIMYFCVSPHFTHRRMFALSLYSHVPLELNLFLFPVLCYNRCTPRQAGTNGCAVFRTFLQFMHMFLLGLEDTMGVQPGANGPKNESRVHEGSLLSTQSHKPCRVLSCLTIPVLRESGTPSSVKT
jgi:hypothetical protein